MDYSNLFVCLMGLCTVFIGLICIIILVSVMSNVVRRTDAKAAAAPAAPAAAAPAVGAVTPAMVAAVAAAIAAAALSSLPLMAVSILSQLSLNSVCRMRSPPSQRFRP